MTKAIIKGSPTRGLAAATLGFFFGSAAISLFGPSATRLNEVMHMTPSMMGLLVAIPTLSGSLLRIPFGASVDGTGGRKSFLWLMSLSVIGLLGLSLLLSTRYPHNMDGTYWLILLLGCLSGCGVATFSVGAGQSSYWYPKNRQGFALGIFGGIGTMGAGLLALALPLLLEWAGFVSAYYLLAIYMLTGTVIYFFFGVNSYFFQYKAQGYTKEESKIKAIEHGQELFPTGNTRESLALSAKVPETWFLVLSYFVTFGGFIALTAWLPTFWQKSHGFSDVKAGIFTAVFALSAALLRIPSGKLSDKIGGLKVSYMAFVILLVASLVMAFSSHWAVSAAGTMVMSIAFGMNNAAVMKLVPVFVHQSVGGATGWVGGIGAFGGFAIPPILGNVVQRMGEAGYDRGFLTFTLLSVVLIIVLYVGLSKTKKEPAPKTLKTDFNGL